MTIDICNNFRDTLKPAFKLLATRINEISAELESFGDINNTYTTVEEVNEVLTNYVQKSEFDKLKQENEALKAQIEALKPKYQWQEFYQGFDERVEFLFNNGISRVAHCIYGTGRTKLSFSYSSSAFDTKKQYQFILVDAVGSTHYFRFDVANNTVYFDEIFGDTQTASPPNNGSFTIEKPMEQTYSPNVPFNYVFVKSVE